VNHPPASEPVAWSEPAEDQWAERYPSLFRPHPHSWGGVRRSYSIELTLDRPDDDLVVNVRLIATEDDRVVVCETAEGWRTLPGGSRERGESIEQTAARELLEEAGCIVAGPIAWFASFTVTGNTSPWRDWHPHPISAWLIGVVKARRLGPPTNPPDGEVVVRVDTLDPDRAVSYLSEFDNGGQAELVALARDLGLIGSTRRPPPLEPR